MYHRVCEMLILNESIENHFILAHFSVTCLVLEIDHAQNMFSRTESVERYQHHTQVIMEYWYTNMEG